jgi:hypothetical protein
MPSKYLYGFYGFFTLGLAVAGIISLLFSILWRKQDMILNMTFSDSDLNGTSCLASPAVIFSQRHLSSAGLVMGIAFLITSSFSVGAIIQRNHVTIGLVILNWILISDAIIVLVVGSFVWFYTLRERAEYHVKYARLQPSQRIAAQDKVSHNIVAVSLPYQPVYQLPSV